MGATAHGREGLNLRNRYAATNPSRPFFPPGPGPRWLVQPHSSLTCKAAQRPHREYVSMVVQAFAGEVGGARGAAHREVDVVVGEIWRADGKWENEPDSRTLVAGRSPNGSSEIFCSTLCGGLTCALGGDEVGHIFQDRDFAAAVGESHGEVIYGEAHGGARQIMIFKKKFKLGARSSA